MSKRKVKIRFYVERTRQGQEDYLRFTARHRGIGEASTNRDGSQILWTELDDSVTTRQLNRNYEDITFLEITSVEHDSDTTEMASAADMKKIRHGVGLESTF